MNDPARSSADNVVPLRRTSKQAQHAAQTAGQVRRQLSLLQGYADLMDGLSPQQNMPILRVMAEKIQALTLALRPFLESPQFGMPAIDDYRQARSRTRRLLADYRLLLDRLHVTVGEAKAKLPPA